MWHTHTSVPFHLGTMSGKESSLGDCHVLHGFRGVVGLPFKLQADAADRRGYRLLMR